MPEPDSPDPQEPIDLDTWAEVEDHEGPLAIADDIAARYGYDDPEVDDVDW